MNTSEKPGGVVKFTALLFAAALLAPFVFAREETELQRLTWDINGVTREALVYIPPAAKTTPCPLVFEFHGHGGTMKYAARSNYHRLWPEALCVYMQGLNTPGKLTDPEGLKSGWQMAAGDQDDRDLKFFDAVLASLKKDYKVDEKRIFATGHSNGGAFTYLLWSERGDIFAAVAPSGAIASPGELPNTLPDFLAQRVAKSKKPAKPLQPKPVLHVAGNKDPLVKYDWQKLTMDALLKLNDCEEGKPWGDCCTYYASKTGTPVITYIYPGGHMPPEGIHPAIIKFFKDQTKQ